MCVPVTTESYVLDVRPLKWEAPGRNRCESKIVWKLIDRWSVYLDGIGGWTPCWSCLGHCPLLGTKWTLSASLFFSSSFFFFFFFLHSRENKKKRTATTATTTTTTTYWGTTDTEIEVHSAENLARATKGSVWKALYKIGQNIVLHASSSRKSSNIRYGYHEQNFLNFFLFNYQFDYFCFALIRIRHRTLELGSAWQKQMWEKDCLEAKI